MVSFYYLCFAKITKCWYLGQNHREFWRKIISIVRPTINDASACNRQPDVRIRLPKDDSGKCPHLHFLHLQWSKMKSRFLFPFFSQLLFLQSQHGLQAFFVLHLPRHGSLVLWGNIPGTNTITLWLWKFLKERESEKGDLAQIGGVWSLWPPRFHLLVQLWTNTGENQVPVRPNVLRKSTCLETGANDEGHHVDVDPWRWRERDKSWCAACCLCERVH